MATFNEVHRRQFRARSVWRPGDWFRVTLLEPLKFDAAPNEVAYLVTYRVTNDRGEFEPATAADRERIEDWERRHRDTPPSAFYLLF